MLRHKPDKRGGPREHYLLSVKVVADECSGDFPTAAPFHSAAKLLPVSSVMSASSHPPQKLIEPVLSIEWFGFVNHQWHSPVTGLRHRLIVGLQVLFDALPTICFKNFIPVQASYRHSAFKMVALVPAGS